MPDTPTLTLVQPLGRGGPYGCVPALGSTRRLQALAAAGWPARPIARLAKLHLRTVQFIRAGQRPYVRADVARMIEDAYDRLSGLDPRQTLPRTGRAARAIAQVELIAARADWKYTPDDWAGLDMDNPKASPDGDAVPIGDDLLELIAFRASTDRIRATWDRLPTDERARVVATLSDDDQPGGGRAAREIAELIGTTARNVQRYRARARELAAPAEPLAVPA